MPNVDDYNLEADLAALEDEVAKAMSVTVFTSVGHQHRIYVDMLYRQVIDLIVHGDRKDANEFRVKIDAVLNRKDDLRMLIKLCRSAMEKLSQTVKPTQT